MELLNEFATLPSQVKVLGLQDTLGKQNVHEDMKQVFGHFTKTIEDALKT